jgi:Right handed beta helix region
VKRIVTPLVAFLLLAVGLTACSTSSSLSSPSGSSPAVVPAAPPPDWDGTVGPRPVAPDCRGDADDPQPGDVICFTGDLDAPLHITVGGLPDAPIVYSGDGDTRVPGIRAEADHVVIQGFVSDGADSTGIWAAGTGITVQDNTITQVRWNENDVDGIRFFGDGARVLHNAVEDLEGTDDVGDAHVDCMQSFATSRPGSQNVVIQGNRCEGIRAQCLMAEGPGVADGSGEGVSRNWLFRGNYCDAYADAQSVAFQDVQNVTIVQNEMVGEGNKAFALGQNSTGAVVKDNRIDEDYGREVGFDDPSAQQGYQGPPAR